MQLYQRSPPPKMNSPRVSSNFSRGAQIYPVITFKLTDNLVPCESTWTTPTTGRPSLQIESAHHVGLPSTYGWLQPCRTTLPARLDPSLSGPFGRSTHLMTSRTMVQKLSSDEKFGNRYCPVFLTRSAPINSLSGDIDAP